MTDLNLGTTEDPVPVRTNEELLTLLDVARKMFEAQKMSRPGYLYDPETDTVVPFDLDSAGNP